MLSVKVHTKYLQGISSTRNGPQIFVLIIPPVVSGTESSPTCTILLFVPLRSSLAEKGSKFGLKSQTATSLCLTPTSGNVEGISQYDPGF